jgi:hypothetical protein
VGRLCRRFSKFGGFEYGIEFNHSDFVPIDENDVQQPSSPRRRTAAPRTGDGPDGSDLPCRATRKIMKPAIVPAEPGVQR